MCVYVCSRPEGTKMRQTLESLQTSLLSLPVERGAERTLWNRKQLFKAFGRGFERDPLGGSTAGWPWPFCGP